LEELEVAVLRRQLAGAERERKLADLYERTDRFLRTEQWVEAITAFEQLRDQEPDYRDTQVCLSKARQGLARREEQRREILDEALRTARAIQDDLGRSQALLGH
jgi:hypothetical protein